MFFKEIRLIMVALTAVFVLSIQSSQAQSMSEADREALYIFDSIVGQMLDYAREREARKRYERRHYYAPPPPPRHYRNRPPAPHYGQQPAPRDYYAPRPNAYYFAPTPADFSFQ